MADTNIGEVVRAVLVTTLGIQDRSDSLTLSTPLLTSVPELDSMAVLEVIGALEDQFGITMDAEDVSEATFETIQSLAFLVQTKLASDAQS